ncbi:MAG: hypothetical protein H6729_05565 [Deltaproteobacteria bacterium]|nr:hypothetical protein [Deltaproteobacteria bacterium]
MTANVGATPNINTARVSTAGASPANGTHTQSGIDLSFEQTDLEGALLKPEESRSWLRRNYGKVAATAVGAFVLARAGFMGIPGARAFAKEAQAASKLDVAGQFLRRTFDLTHWTGTTAAARATEAAVTINKEAFELGEPALKALETAFSGINTSGKTVLEFIKTATSKGASAGDLERVGTVFADSNRAEALGNLKKAAPKFFKHVETVLKRAEQAATTKA